MKSKKIFLFSIIAHLLIILILIISNMSFNKNSSKQKVINNELSKANFVELSTIPDMAVSKKIAKEIVIKKEIKPIPPIKEKTHEIKPLIKEQKHIIKEQPPVKQETKISEKSEIKKIEPKIEEVSISKKEDVKEILKEETPEIEIKEKVIEENLKENKTSSLNSIEGQNEVSAYRDLIYDIFYSNWNQPQYIEKGWTCRVMVQQNNNGEIIDAIFYNDCEVNNQFKGSIKEAIARSYKLPLPKDKSIFNEYIEVNFRIR